MRLTYLILTLSLILPIGAQAESSLSSKANEPLVIDPNWANRYANPRLTLIGWENRSLPAVETDTPLSVSPDIIHRSETSTLATRSTRDGVRRQLEQAHRSQQAPSTPWTESTRPGEGFVRVRSADATDGNLSSQRAASPAPATKTSVAGPISNASEHASDLMRVSAGGIPTPLIVLLALGAAGALYLLKRSLEE